MNIQWYPGHMTKAKRLIADNLKLVDLVIEIIDARAPISTRNPDINQLTQGKNRLVVLNKTDLANKEQTELWKTHFEQMGLYVVTVNSSMKSARNTIINGINTACKGKIERNKKRGINKTIRAMVLGIPNVGKSTVINTLVGRSGAKTGNKPGVTRGKQWLKVKDTVELLDTPGVLWPKFEHKEIGINLCMIGSIKDEIFNHVEIALTIIYFLRVENPNVLIEMASTIQGDDYEVFTRIGKNRHFLVKGGEIDDSRTAMFILEQFRNGKLGSYTLEKIDEEHKRN